MTSETRRRCFPDFLILGQEQWDQVERRNQLLIRALAVRNPGSRFVFAERAIRPRQLRDWRWPRPVRVAANIWAVQLIRPMPDRVSAELSNRAEARQVARAARAIGLHRPYVWTQDPHTADLLGMLPGVGLIYDLTDDWVAFESDLRLRALVQHRFEKLVQAADIVFACSPRLVDVAARSGSDATYLPNAIDGLVARASVPRRLAAIPQPRLGYVGTLHSSRLDLELLVEAAALRPGWSFVFLGPDLLAPADRARLFALPNTHYLGVCPHTEVARYLGGFDVGLVPNRISDFTDSLDPLKTYEYLAGGVPVLATAAGVTPKLASQVHLASTASELVAVSERLIAGNSLAEVDVRRALVAGETWDVRAAVIERRLGVTEPTEAIGVSTVIISFNTQSLLRRCLAALRDQSSDELQTIVVDNGSTDGSQAMVRTEYPEVELVESAANIGFGPANNLAFDRCRGEFILLLNSDAFLHPGALNELVAAARRHPEAAVIGPRLLNPDGTLQRSAWPFPSARRLLLEAVGGHRILRRSPLFEDLGTWDHLGERAVDFLVGACLLVRTRALDEVGGFDEDFYMYAEETDLQWRLTNREWSVIFTPAAAATHVGGASSVAATSRLEQFYGGQMRFLTKHRGLTAVVGARIALLVGSLLRRRWRVARLALTAGREQRAR